MEEPNFWDNPEEAQEQMKQLSSMKEDRDTYQKLVSAKEDMETLIEMGQEEDDDSVVPEIAEMMEEFKASFDAIRIKTLLSGEFDKDNAIIKLNAGAGGTEACDWCGMLYRMYTRWAERKGFTIEELDFLDGDEAGVKSVTFQVNGENAYGYLKSEKGVHRLVRISPFNAAGKRQTSFVSCDVMPDIDKEIDVEVRDEDIRIDTYRSSGAGGQQDFVLGAYLSKGGKSFICLSSTHADKDGTLHSRIRPTLQTGSVVTDTRVNTMYVVTEYGCVCLKGLSVWERAEKLISIAHPDFREELIRAAEQQKIWYPHNRR